MPHIRIAIDTLTTDPALQQRTSWSDEYVKELAQAYRDHDPVPPIEVIDDEETRWVWDGHYRVAGAKAAGLTHIECHVEAGEFLDAKRLSCGANADFGERRTAADRWRAVETMLAEEEWKGRSDRWLADHCKVSHTFVAKVRDCWEAGGGEPSEPAMPMAGAARETEATEPRGRMGRDGRVQRRTSGQGRNQRAMDAKPTRGMAKRFEEGRKLLLRLESWIEETALADSSSARVMAPKVKKALAELQSVVDQWEQRSEMSLAT